MVSTRVVKIGSSTSPPAGVMPLKTTSQPSERPIQFSCIFLMCSGHWIVFRSFSSGSAYSVILKYHCFSDFLVTAVSVWRQHLPSSTCSLARIVMHSGHHH